MHADVDRRQTSRAEAGQSLGVRDEKGEEECQGHRQDGHGRGHRVVGHHGAEGHDQWCRAEAEEEEAPGRPTLEEEVEEKNPFVGQEAQVE